jgi:phage terminase Nu1 subunit (DNA packaging protein)
MHEYTINKCAEMIEKDRATLARALRTIPPDAGTPKRPLYRLATVVRALIAYEIKPDGRRGNGDEARLAAERARLAREQADAVALKNAVARRELIHRELVVRSGQIIVAAFRERCLAVPGKLAVFGPEAEMAARDEIYECLEELSRPILSDDKVPWSDDGAAAEAADDTADEGGTK